jgi:hypothetical protein
MKKLTILLFSILISFSSYGEWTKVGENAIGDTTYIDTSTIKERNGYVYWWAMMDYLVPTEQGSLSSKTLTQNDCYMYRNKLLSFSSYKQPMGSGRVYLTTNPSNPEWVYTSPGSMGSIEAEYGCNYVK